jgi:hypothetical protein
MVVEVVNNRTFLERPYLTVRVPLWFADVYQHNSLVRLMCDGIE